MIPAAKSLTFYKDYNKDVKDMLTKSYSNAQKWKVECKYKGPKDTIFVNPTATSDGKFSTDVEFVPSQCGAKLKLTFIPDCCDLKGTATYELKDHKIEAVVNKKGDYEVSHECKVQNRFSSHAKLVKNNAEVGLGLSVARYCQVGCGAAYQLDGKSGCDWTASCRYAEAGRVFAIRTDKLQSYTTSVMTPVPTCPHPVTVGAEVVCGRSKGWTGTLGVEAACVLFKKNSLKVRVNKDLEWAVAYIAKLADNWTAAVTLDKNLKPGVLLTHS
ncbi:putative voltage-dependent anion-selective channel [Trypanosoma grayi]|uniref:putative voltage-dependent anion-selective channel n=1 Tax=Trypanosoma grayi TaxID=71804 RepID=UPI0004F4A279|nr:putative voltage-dependent anion-selective channel [Trypanosoma grayi]KEG09481.1 putative voltage-dependent anion-selective channel [Trypanosoma grayi]